jgi:hypothetical protein
MALVLKDRIKETTATTGTGTYTLAGAVDGFESFSEVGDTNTTYYCCTDGLDFEIGIGTYTASGTTLARTTILQSTNADAAVNWSAGDKDIFVTLAAEKLVFEDASGNVAVAGTVDGRDIATDGTKLDGIEVGADVTDVTNVTAAGAAMLTGAVFTGAVTVPNLLTSGLIDGRDISVDGAKLDGIEPGADVTDVTNVAATGAMTPGYSGTFTIADNGTIFFGNGNDLFITHNGTNSLIRDQNVGDLQISGANVVLQYRASNGTLTSRLECGQFGLQVYDGTTLVCDFNNSGVVYELNMQQQQMNVKERHLTPTAAASMTFNGYQASSYSFTRTTNITSMFFSGVAGAQASSITMYISANSSGTAYTIAWPSSVKWPGGTAPTLTNTPNAVDIFVFTTHNGGTDWYGFIAGQDMS